MRFTENSLTHHHVADVSEQSSQLQTHPSADHEPISSDNVLPSHAVVVLDDEQGDLRSATTIMNSTMSTPTAAPMLPDTRSAMRQDEDHEEDTFVDHVLRIIDAVLQISGYHHDYRVEDEDEDEGSILAPSLE